MITLDFKMNELVRGETTILVYTPTQISLKIGRKTNLRNKLSSPDEEDTEWYQIPNDKALILAKSIIREMRYAKYSMSDIRKAIIRKTTMQEYTYTISSTSNKLYKLFIEKYKEMTEN